MEALNHHKLILKSTYFFHPYDTPFTPLGIPTPIVPRVSSEYFRKHTKLFAYISATKYRSEAVLYSKRTAGHPLSSHIKTITVAFLQAE